MELRCCPVSRGQWGTQRFATFKRCGKLAESDSQRGKLTLAHVQRKLTLSPAADVRRWSAAAPAAKVSSSYCACGMGRPQSRKICRLCRGRFLRFADFCTDCSIALVNWADPKVRSRETPRACSRACAAPCWKVRFGPSWCRLAAASWWSFAEALPPHHRKSAESPFSRMLHFARNAASLPFLILSV
jgi:hypothetical protein